MTARSHAATLLRNTSVLSLGNVLSPMASMVLVLAIGRWRGPEELGVYSLAMAVFLFGEGLAALGLPVVVTREVAATPGRAGAYFVAGTAVAGAIVGGLVALAVPLLFLAGGATPLTLTLAFLVASFLPSVVTAMGVGVLLGLERVADFVCIDFVERLARAVAGTALVCTGHGIVAVAALTALLRVVAAAAYLGALRRAGVGFPPRDRVLCASLRHEVPVVGTIPVLNALYARVDMLVLGALASLGDVGHYGAALRIVDVMRSFPAAFGRALYPRLSRLWSADRPGFRGEAAVAARPLLIAIGAAVLVVHACATDVVALLFGPAFAPAAAALRALAWLLPPYALACLLSTVLFASAHQADDLRANLVCLAVAPALQAVLVVRHGLRGACAATLLAMLLYAALQYAFVRRRTGSPGLVPLLAKLGLALALGVATIHGLGHRPGPLGAAGGLAAFLLGLLLTGLLSRSDLVTLRRAVRAPAECGS